MAEYGIPYMGSKSKICNELIKVFPKAENFYDIFGGGFSVTHAMLTRRSKDYKSFHFNELRAGVCELIKDAIAGKYNYDVFKPPFVSSEEFFDRVEKDAYVKCLWSFGNKGTSYLFSKEIEPYKKSIHNAIIFNEFDDIAQKTLGMNKFKDGYGVKDRRLFVRNRIETFRKTKIPEFLYPYLSEDQLEKSKSMNSLERLERLQQLEQLERLQQLEQLTFYSTTYDNVPIKQNSIIYCDPPYEDTADYQSDFNTNKFLDWAAKQNNPVFISEYDITDKRFHLIFKINKRSMLSSNKEMKVKVEKVYANDLGRYAFLKHARGIK